MVRKYYEDRDYSKEICILKLVEYLEKNDHFTEWLINDYALYVDEWIEERENSIIIEEMKQLEQDTEKITNEISSLESKQVQLNKSIQQIKNEINRYNYENSDLMNQLYRPIA